MTRLRRIERKTTTEVEVILEIDGPGPDSLDPTPTAASAAPEPDPDNEESGVFPRLAPGPQALARRPVTDLALWRERREAS